MNIQNKPSCLDSIVVLLGIVSILMTGIFILHVDIHVLLILGLILTCLVSYKCGYSLDEMIDGMKLSVSRAMGALIIFILIGMIIATWIQCGTVPALIYYGLKILSPKYFLPAGLIICSIVSLGTGTSWGTIGTIGLAMMGMGTSLGMPAPVVAGMVVSGAFFGDKMSPISDTTNLSAVSAGTDLYKHIKGMLYTTIPSYIISLGIYTYIGKGFYVGASSDFSQIELIQDVLSHKFNLNPIVILPMVIVLVLNIMKISSIPTMVIGTVLGGIFAVVFQCEHITSVLNVVNYGYTDKTGIELIDKLLIRGGIQNMMWTFSLSFIALCLGGVLEKAGFIEVIIEKIIKKVKSTGSLVALVITSCTLANASMGEIYLSVILNGSLYKSIFEERGFENNMLSRVLEEGATLTGALIPWTTAGAFISSTLGVSTFAYAPYALLNIINPILSIVLSYLGIFVFMKDKSVEEQSA